MHVRIVHFTGIDGLSESSIGLIGDPSLDDPCLNQFCIDLRTNGCSGIKIDVDLFPSGLHLFCQCVRHGLGIA